MSNLVLGIESSCDETAAAIVADSHTIRANIVASQVAIHQRYGGVVPELASRHHIRNVSYVVDQALREAGVTLEQIDGIAVTRGPGLVGALLVGLQFAKALAYARQIALVGVNHLEGHLCAPRLSATPPPERHLALLVSGGHTALYAVERFAQYRLLGATRDDAAGEAFDKVAKLLSLGYPGGPIIERLARDGDPDAIDLPRALPRRDEIDFSFSGLKTAVMNYVRAEGSLSEQQVADLCASFQQAVIDVLTRKTARAAQIWQSSTDQPVSGLVAGGGVMANSAVREAMQRMASENGLQLFIPAISLCTDNAAMIAAAGALRLAAGERADLTLNASARLPL